MAFRMRITGSGQESPLASMHIIKLCLLFKCVRCGDDSHSGDTDEHGNFSRSGGALRAGGQAEIVGKCGSRQKTKHGDGAVRISLTGQDELPQGTAAQEHAAKASQKHAKSVPKTVGVGHRLPGKAQLEIGGASQSAKDQVNDLLKHSFRPEFLNRLDEIVFYKPLTKDNITHIIDLMVDGINRRLEDKQLKVQLTASAKDFIIDSAYDPIYGARPLRRYLQHTVETLISRKIIAGEVESGDTLTVDCKDGALAVSASQVFTGEVVDL